MNKKQYEDKRKNLMNEAQTFIDEGKTKEAEAKMDEVRALDEQWEGIAQAQANFNALNNEPKPVNLFGADGAVSFEDTNESDANLTPAEKAWASENYTNAWAKFLMGQPLSTAEQNAFNLVNEAYTHTTGNTQLVIPKTVTKGIWEEAGEIYPYYGDVAKTYVNGVLSMIQEDTSSEAAWYEEDTATEDGKETFKEFTLSGCELARAITVSWKLKEMAIEEFIPYIRRKMAAKMGAALGYGATHGTGKATEGKPEPIGTVTALESEAGTPQIVKYAGDVPTYQEITNARSKVTKLANVVDGDGRPLFVPDPTAAGVFRILGMPVKEDDSMKDAEILFSNPERGYHMNINKEMTMLPEDHVRERKTDYCGYAVVDGNVTTTKAHALLKLSA